MDRLKSSIAGIITLLKIFILFLIALGGSGLLIIGLMQIYKETIPKQVAISSIVILGGFTALLLWICLFLFLIHVIRAFVAHWQIFGDTTSVRLIGLGITTALFPQVIYFITSPVYFITNLILQLPTTLENFWSLIEKGRDIQEYKLDELIKYLFRLLQNIGIDIAQALLQMLKYLPIKDLFMALAFWAVIGHLLSSSTPASEADPASSSLLGNSRLAKALQSISDTKRSNILLCLIFLFSTYLSIAAIVAIPWLQQKESTETLSKDQLKQRLEGAILTPAEFDSRFPENIELKADPFSALFNLLSTDSDSLEKKMEPIKLTPDVKELWNSRLAQVKAEIDQFKQNRSQIIANWKRYRKEVRDTEINLLNSALTNFETEMLSPMSIQERAFYFQEIDQWFRKTMRDLNNSLTKCLNALEKRDKDIEFFTKQQENSIENNISYLTDYAKNKGKAPERYEIGWKIDSLAGMASGISLRQTDMSYYFQLPTDLESQPNPPEPGLGWGPFGWVSKWLLRTKSLPLALISGMLGFGLFGAAISSFVREQAARTQDQPLVKDIAGVMVRGLSAAVVIFLAAKGGLAIVAVGDQQPNAYVLFFTCFVGAVFSEEVWNWAHKRLSLDLTGKGSTTATPATTTSIPPSKPDGSTPNNNSENKKPKTEN